MRIGFETPPGGGESTTSRRARCENWRPRRAPPVPSTEEAGFARRRAEAEGRNIIEKDGAARAAIHTRSMMVVIPIP
jgi:hypothetical protein